VILSLYQKKTGGKRASCDSFLLTSLKKKEKERKNTLYLESKSEKIKKERRVIHKADK